MFIQTEATPNPEAMKFLPGRAVTGSGTATFAAGTAVEASPLAQRLIALEGVSEVFLAPDFISVTKVPTGDWLRLKPAILGAIMEHFQSGDPVLVQGAAEAAEDGAVESYDPADAEIVVQIKELLETRVRPAVARDGGDIVFRGFEQGVVFLDMQGSCAGCPSSTATLKMGIEQLLKHYVPEVVEVRALG
ncbi:MAG: NifU family protein [Alphaproteobacteria bacterium]